MNLVFDIGGTFVRSAVVRNGITLEHFERTRIAGAPATAGSGRWRDVMLAMERFTAHIIDKLGAPQSIAISFPGPIDGRGAPLCAPTISGPRIAVPDFLQALAMVSCPIFVLNDVAAAAWYLGETTSCNRFITVTVSSGIGAKVYDRARSTPVLDCTPFAGELGHLTVDDSPDAQVCDCGGRGHLGAIASGRAVEHRARVMAGRSLSNEEHIVSAVRNGEGWAVAIVQQSIEALAQVLAPAIVAMGLERVFVIGGFACALGPVYGAMLEQSIRKRLPPPDFGTPEETLVNVADIGEEACLKGAALFARRAAINPCV